MEPHSPSYNAPSKGRTGLRSAASSAKNALPSDALWNPSVGYSERGGPSSPVWRTQFRIGDREKLEARGRIELEPGCGRERTGGPQAQSRAQRGISRQSQSTKSNPRPAVELPPLPA